jgi:hypothetical protein
MMAVFIPITRPCIFNSGPPELPGLITALVWMVFAIEYPVSGFGKRRAI